LPNVVIPTNHLNLKSMDSAPLWRGGAQIVLILYPECKCILRGHSPEHHDVCIYCNRYQVVHQGAKLAVKTNRIDPCSQTLGNAPLSKAYSSCLQTAVFCQAVTTSNTIIQSRINHLVMRFHYVLHIHLPHAVSHFCAVQKHNRARQ